MADSIPQLPEFIDQKKIQLFENTSFPLPEARAAFQALEGRSTIGKIVLIPIAASERRASKRIRFGT